MSKIMAVNAGSSSLKFQLLEMPEEKLIVSGLVEKIGTVEVGHVTFKVNGEKIIDEDVEVKDHAKAVQIVLDGLLEKKLINSLDEIGGVGHRIVQGGPYFNDSCLITPESKAKIKELCPLAPLHNPAHLVGIDAFEEVLEGVPNVAVFDTSFHQTMPETSYLYGVPYEWYTNYKVRKYGAHGTSHQYVSKKCAELMGKPYEDLKIVTCHLGNGASLAAVQNGKCVDTTMGLTPLDGFPMGTRSGSLDPTVVEYMCVNTGMTVEEVLVALNRKSGYLGISGVSNDSRTVEAGLVCAPDATDEQKEVARRCKLAFDLQYKRICDYIGSYYVLMEGIDAIVFTAGIGENSDYCREHVCERLKVLGVEIDKQVNSAKSTRGNETLISTPNSKIKVYVIPTNEELCIARDVIRLTK